MKEALDALGVAVTAAEGTAAGDAIPGSARLTLDQIVSTMRSGMQNAKNAVMNDIEELLSVPQPAASDYAAWLARSIAKYDGWRRRLRE